MRTSASKQGRGRGWFGRGSAWASLAVVGGGAALIAPAASGPLIVDTNANQCSAATVGADCGAFPGLRSCVQGVCQVATKAPSCMKTSDCSTYGSATCVSGACARTCTTASQCSTGDTCTAGACSSGPAAGSCKVNADCATKGTYYICRKDTLQCVNLESSLCTTVYGDYKNDDAFIFGSIAPTTGPDMSTGVPLQNSIELAVNDFTQNAGGLPPAVGQSARRPLAFVGCSDNSDNNTAIAAAQHLVNDVGVPAIIGAAFSGVTIAVANTVTIPGKVMLFSPSATSVAITSLDTSVPRLLWRSSPPDTFQAQALSLYMSQPNSGLEATVRANLSLMASDSIKVAVLHKGDAYGNGLATGFVGSPGQVEFNGKPATDPANSAYFKDIDYGNPDDPTHDAIKYSATVTTTVAFAPHIIFIFGTNEGVDDIFEEIDKSWSTSTYYPLYVFSDGGEIGDLPTYVATAKSPGAASLRTRISGSVPGTNNALYQDFLTEYQGQFNDGSNPTTFGAAGAYDIVYMLGYAASALLAPGVKTTTIHGSDLANGMASLVPGGSRAELDVGGNNINQAFSSLIAGTGIDYNGASGPLNFDLKTGEAPSDIQIWCVNQPSSTEINSGLYFDAANLSLTGAFTACN